MWSTPKTNDPEVVGNDKKAGVWVNYGGGKIEEATFQESDQTLRVTESMTNQVKTIKVDVAKKTLQMDTKYGGIVTYHKLDRQKRNSYLESF